MSEIPPCPKCQSAYVYEDGILLICPECSYEWSKDTDLQSSDVKVVRDANGIELKDGDTVTVIKDLKFRGGVVKVGTKVKSIRLIPEAADGHDIDCKIPGIGQMGLKSEFVKKVTE
ncbi:MAG: alkylphosphonate utilization protein [Alphaproteobacteria bacterium CG_4_9_14_3_um_filter_47_13]|nr:MAG: alkylphosphonate utilization protein [Alphaproteobacteria bacterium CG_4_9_14_3_um_filter_47_13]